MSKKKKVKRPVELNCQDLISPGVNLSKLIEEAYGMNGLGILTVSGIPELAEKRSALLPLARRFAALSEEVKKQYEQPESYYAFGWSHGKENLQGKPDLQKGSYYANPLYDVPTKDPAIISRYPAFASPNTWPTKYLPELEHAFKDLGQLTFQVGLLVARQCDSYVKSQCPSYPAHQLEDTIRDSVVCKGRLLHYFPMQQSGPDNTTASDLKDDNNTDFSNWCGWHNDHGSLTGLTAAMYLDEEGQEVDRSSSQEKQDDDDSGLYVLNRLGEMVKVVIPSNHLAFQIGETSQIHSAGILQATPHAVKGCSSRNVSRETFAVFLEPSWDEAMDVPPTKSPQDAQNQLSAQSLPKGVPPLKTRWSPGMSFGEFTAKTLAAYH